MQKSMIKKIISILKKLNKFKFRFDFPRKKKILLFDEEHSLTLKQIIKKDFNVLKVRDEKEIYFWIFLKQVILFDFKFLTYCENYIKFISPKIMITFIDTNLLFYELKDSFNNIQFIAIQNGVRVEKNTMFYNKLFIKPKKLKCDHIFVLNKYYIKEYQRIIDSKYHVLGNFKNNMIKINKTKIKDDFLFISTFNINHLSNLKFEKKLLNYINLYLNKYNKKIHILPRHKLSSPFKHQEEINFFKNFFQSKCTFPTSSDLKRPYVIVDKFEKIIFMYSTLGFEAISRKKKVAIFSPKIQFRPFVGKLNSVWPAPYLKKYDFFSSKHISYNEIERVLNNINNCSQTNWEKKYYGIIKDQLHLNKDNTKLKKLIFRLL
jgi:surface carbohydrate biosynthesis protein